MHEKLKVIQQLMQELQDEMQYGEDDFAERLGKKKPDIEVVKVEGSMDQDPMLEKKEEKLGMDLDGDMEMGEDPEHAEMVMGEDEGPEEKLKNRLMKLRG